MTILTNTGRSMITNYMTSTTAASLAKWVGWGTGVTGELVSQTVLATEVNTAGSAGVARSGTNAPSQTLSNVANDTFQVIQTITASAGVTIAEAGLFDLSSAGNMLLRGTFSGIPLANGDSIQFTFKLTFS